MPARAPIDTPQTGAANGALVRAGLVVSAQSLAWTVAGSTAAVAIGIVNGSGALVAFGAVGVVDAIGSAGLVYHFRHALRHEEISSALEAVVHRVVLAGLVTVGLSTVVVDTVRLIAGGHGRASSFGTGLAAVSLVVLGLLSARKARIARRIPSAALRADGHLSAVGACLAAITLAGTAATQAFAWDWADAAAAIFVGAVAVMLGVASWLGERRLRRRLRAAIGADG